MKVLLTLLVAFLVEGIHFVDLVKIAGFQDRIRSCGLWLCLFC
jgi:hypothetical protein